MCKGKSMNWVSKATISWCCLWSAGLSMTKWPVNFLFLSGSQRVPFMAVTIL